MSETPCETTHDKRVETAGKIALAATSIQPKAGDWGVLVFDDRAPIFCGAGMGCFLWFTDETSMGDFLAHHLPFFVDANWDDEESRAAAQEIDDLWSAGMGSLALPERISGLNTRLQNLVQVEWAGPVADLLEGAGKPEAYRTWYREVAAIEVDSSPIPPAQQESFLEALAEYGG